MVNIFNFKQNTFLIICILAISMCAFACSQKKTTDSEEIAKQENIATLEMNENTIVVVENDKDAMFLMEATAMQFEAISLGELAQGKGNAKHVKDLGKMMEADHTKMLAELTKLAQSKSIAIPTSITEDSKEVFNELNKKNGNEFGKEYSNMMVDHHEDAIELFEKIEKESEDTEIKSWAASKVPSLKLHLQHAEACKKECDKM